MKPEVLATVYEDPEDCDLVFETHETVLVEYDCGIDLLDNDAGGWIEEHGGKEVTQLKNYISKHRGQMSYARPNVTAYRWARAITRRHVSD